MNIEIIKSYIPEIVTQLLGFLIVFFVLKKYAFGAILGVIDARRKHIEDEIAAAEKKRLDMEALEKDYRKRLDHIEQEARERIQEASNIGQTLAKDIQDRARIDAQRIVDRTKAELDQDIMKARIVMRNEVVEISSLIAEKVLREKLNTQEHEKLVEKFLRELEKVS